MNKPKVISLEAPPDEPGTKAGVSRQLAWALHSRELIAQEYEDLRIQVISLDKELRSLRTEYNALRAESEKKDQRLRDIHEKMVRKERAQALLDKEHQGYLEGHKDAMEKVLRMALGTR